MIIFGMMLYDILINMIKRLPQTTKHQLLQHHHQQQQQQPQQHQQYQQQEQPDQISCPIHIFLSGLIAEMFVVLAAIAMMVLG